MKREDFERLFLFDTDFSDKSHTEEVLVSTEDWDTEWDVEIKGQCMGLKAELESMRALEESRR